MALLPSNQRPYHALLAGGVLFSFMACSEIYSRAEIDVEGQVLSIESKCQEPQHNRCVSTYVLASKNGLHSSYSAGPNDASLQRNVPVGAYLVKHRWHLSYSIDNQEIDDFPIGFYGGLFALSIVAVLFWAHLHRTCPR